MGTFVTGATKFVALITIFSLMITSSGLRAEDNNQAPPTIKASPDKGGNTKAQKEQDEIKEATPIEVWGKLTSDDSFRNMMIASFLASFTGGLIAARIRLRVYFRKQVERVLNEEKMRPDDFLYADSLIRDAERACDVKRAELKKRIDIRDLNDSQAGNRLAYLAIELELAQLEYSVLMRAMARLETEKGLDEGELTNLVPNPVPADERKLRKYFKPILLNPVQRAAVEARKAAEIDETPAPATNSEDVAPAELISAADGVAVPSEEVPAEALAYTRDGFVDAVIRQNERAFSPYQWDAALRAFYKQASGAMSDYKLFALLPSSWVDAKVFNLRDMPLGMRRPPAAIFRGRFLSFSNLFPWNYLPKIGENSWAKAVTVRTWNAAMPALITSGAMFLFTSHLWNSSELAKANIRSQNLAEARRQYEALERRLEVLFYAERLPLVLDAWDFVSHQERGRFNFAFPSDQVMVLTENAHKHAVNVAGAYIDQRMHHPDQKKFDPASIRDVAAGRDVYWRAFWVDFFGQLHDAGYLGNYEPTKIWGPALDPSDPKSRGAGLEGLVDIAVNRSRKGFFNILTTQLQYQAEWNRLREMKPEDREKWVNSQTDKELKAISRAKVESVKAFEEARKMLKPGEEKLYQYEQNLPDGRNTSEKLAPAGPTNEELEAMKAAQAKSKELKASDPTGQKISEANAVEAARLEAERKAIADAEAKKKADEEAKKKAEAEAKAKTDADAKAKADAEAKAKTEAKPPTPPAGTPGPMSSSCEEATHALDVVIVAE